MTGPRCDAACREHPSCALGALVDYLVEVRDAIVDELDSATLPVEVNALEHLHAAHQLTVQAVAVVDRRTTDLLRAVAAVACSDDVDSCTRHPACLAVALRQRTQTAVAITATVLEDSLARCRVPNPWALTMELRTLVDWAQQQLQVHNLEVAFALPEASS